MVVCLFIVVIILCLIVFLCFGDLGCPLQFYVIAVRMPVWVVGVGGLVLDC